MNELFRAMVPEIVLCVVAGILILMGVSRSPHVRRFCPVLAIAALLIAALTQLSAFNGHAQIADKWQTVRITEFARYVKLLSSVVGILLVMLAWPSDEDATGNAALSFGSEAGEFYGLMLLSIAGIFVVAGASDIMLLFLGIELASIPTYIMVSVSRPLAVAQEAGVKYFFLGAMAAALMLFGFSYLYGTTGTTKLDEIQFKLASAAITPWQTLAVIMLIGGFAFKMAVVPLHAYVGDVYQGAATPVTAFLSYVPKISGFVALLKVLFAVTGGGWLASPEIIKLIWVLAALTMTVGNILGIVQAQNVKRMLACSSIAHSGYMLVAVAALITTADPNIQNDALRGILFYLTAYAIMNIGAFGVLILLPSKKAQAATSAETLEDLAGQGTQHPFLALAMAVSCFSLIGLPLTVGFFGKIFLIVPAWEAQLNWLVVILVINAAISAAYYLRIVAAMFLRPLATDADGEARPAAERSLPVLASVCVSMVAVLWLGIALPATARLTTRATTAAHMEKIATATP